MDRFDDDERDCERKITLRNKKEYSERYLFESFSKSRNQERDMLKALYLMVVTKPFEVVVDDSKERALDFEDILKLKEPDRTKSSKATFVIDGKEYDECSFETLKSTGCTINLR